MSSLPRSLSCGLLASLFLSRALLAQTDVPALPPSSDVVSTTLGSWPLSVATTITLGYVPLPQSIVAIPRPPPAPVVVAPGAALRLAIPFAAAEISSLQWFKDDRALPTTAATLEITAATTTDSGAYRVEVRRADQSLWNSDPVTVRVIAPSRSLLNLSTLVTLSAATPSLATGFVVAATPENSPHHQLLFIRALGPSLAKFGLAHPLARPQFKFYNARGQELAWVFATPDPKKVAALVGAFPLDEGTADLAVALPFPAGAYSVRLFGLDGGVGDVLLEIYQVPDSAFDALFYLGGPTPLPP